MKTLWVLACVCAALGTAVPASAHHVGGHGGPSYFNPFSTTSRPPRTFLSFTFSVDSLDANLGEVIRYQLSGEYAVHRRFSIGVRLPFLTVHERFLPESTGIGDVALTLKGLLWSRPAKRMSLSLGNAVSFPTGNEARGLGAGEVLFSPFL
ncbi:MAG TPA: hypothetical protein DF383_00165, partial [Deltaproteobacteria bacterium]|nr:hypothetical protein [Deltaproteobacteria bacterium]